MPVSRVRALVLNGGSKFSLAEELHRTAGHNDAGLTGPPWHAIRRGVMRLQRYTPREDRGGEGVPAKSR